jgi:hypothetical protein
MSAAMGSVEIKIDGRKTFRCPVGWSAGEARTEIQARYLLTGGGIHRDGIPIRSTDLITADGAYKFQDF